MKGTRVENYFKIIAHGGLQVDAMDSAVKVARWQDESDEGWCEIWDSGGNSRLRTEVTPQPRLSQTRHPCL